MCYDYVNSETLQNYDPFEQLKYKAFDESEITMIAIAEFLILQLSKVEVNNAKLKILFIQILKVFFICVLYLFYIIT